MSQLMNLQDEYRKNYDLFQGYKTAEDYARDYRSVVNTNREEGKAEGRNERDVEHVTNMFKKNLSAPQIADLLGLSEKRVNEIVSTLQ